jgi:hypothetical protein
VVPSEDARIGRVEDNLLPAVMIEGRGGGRPIAERMAEHGVRGLALAVLDEGRVIWTRGYGDATPERRFPTSGLDLGVSLPDPASAAEVGAALAGLPRTAAAVRRERGGHAIFYDPAVGHGAVTLTAAPGGAALGAEVLRAVAVEYRWQGHPGPAVKKEADVPADRLADYPGSYRVAPDLVLTVALEEGRLTVETPGGPAAELHPAGDDRFFLLARDATFVFERDGSGAVVAVAARIGGREIRAVRE